MFLYIHHVYICANIRTCINIYIYISLSLSLFLSLSLCAGDRIHKNWVVDYAVFGWSLGRCALQQIRQVTNLSAEHVRQHLPRHRDTGSFVPQRDAWQDQRRLSLRTGGWRPRVAQRLSSEACLCLVTGPPPIVNGLKQRGSARSGAR